MHAMFTVFSFFATKGKIQHFTFTDLLKLCSLTLSYHIPEGATRPSKNPKDLVAQLQLH